MSEHHVMVTQQTRSEIPQKSTQQPAKPDCVTAALMSIFETRVIDVLPALGFLFLTYNVVDALFKAGGDYKMISFVVFSYANLIALFYCLKSFERLPEGESPKKRRLKIAIWTLATSHINLSFSYRVTSILESVVMSSLVWTLAVATTVGSYETRVVDVLPGLGFLFLTYNVVDALLKAGGNCKMIFFVVFSYANLIALFYCLKSSRRTKSKIAMRIFAASLCLLFSTLLDLSFSSRVTSVLNSVVTSSFVWTLAVATTVGAFYGLFVLPDV